MEDKFPQLFDSIKKGLALVLLVLVLLALVLLDILQFVVTFTVGHITVVCGYSWQKLQITFYICLLTNDTSSCRKLLTQSD